MDQERLEAMPLLEKGISECKVTMEDNVNSKEDQNQCFLKSSESSVSEHAEAKEH